MTDLHVLSLSGFTPRHFDMSLPASPLITSFNSIMSYIDPKDMSFTMLFTPTSPAKQGLQSTIQMHELVAPTYDPNLQHQSIIYNY
jgi:hypothetical protein